MTQDSVLRETVNELLASDAVHVDESPNTITTYGETAMMGSWPDGVQAFVDYESEEQRRDNEGRITPRIRVTQRFQDGYDVEEHLGLVGELQRATWKAKNHLDIQGYGLVSFDDYVLATDGFKQGTETRVDQPAQYDGMDLLGEFHSTYEGRRIQQDEKETYVKDVLGHVLQDVYTVTRRLNK